MSFTVESKPSVIILRRRNVRPTRIGPVLCRVLKQAEPEILEGTIVTVDEGGVRVRKLGRHRSPSGS